MTAELHRNPWDSLIAGVDAGRYDIVLNNVAPTEERKKKYDFSVPYAHSRARVGVKKDSSLKNASEISGHTAAQSATSNYRKLVENAAPPLSRSQASMRLSSRCSPAVPS